MAGVGEDRLVEEETHSRLSVTGLVQLARPFPRSMRHRGPCAQYHGNARRLGSPFLPSLQALPPRTPCKERVTLSGGAARRVSRACVVASISIYF